MILLKNKKYNIFSLNSFKKLYKNVNLKEKQKELNVLQDAINDYESNYNFDYFICTCKSDRFNFYGTYTRNIGIYGSFLTIKIKRIKCKCCGKTHALIPGFIIPYFQTTISQLLDIIFNQKKEKLPLKDISIYYEQSRQFIYFLIKRFNNHFTRLETTFNKDLKDVLIILKCVDNRIKYQELNGTRFLQKIYT